MESIDVFLYSYKNKILPTIALNILGNANLAVKIYIYDQNPVDRTVAFKDNPNIFYTHIMWDIQYGVGKFYSEFLKESKSRYVLFLSDDVTLSPSWDTQTIELSKLHNAVISGNGPISLSKKDEFSFAHNYKPSSVSTKTQWIDRAFIFIDKNMIDPGIVPTNIKYYGFEEYMTMLVRKRSDIYSANTNIYTDSRKRNVENLYVTYSLEHGYNQMIDELNSNSEMAQVFIRDHALQGVTLSRLPYNADDVSYDPSVKFNIDLLSNENKKYNIRVNRIG